MARGGVEVLSYVHGPAPESDGVRTWPCRLYAHLDPGRSPDCERVQKSGAGYVCGPCARREAERWFPGRRRSKGGAS